MLRTEHGTRQAVTGPPASLPLTHLGHWAEEASPQLSCPQVESQKSWSSLTWGVVNGFAFYVIFLLFVLHFLIRTNHW